MKCKTVYTIFNFNELYFEFMFINLDVINRIYRILGYVDVYVCVYLYEYINWTADPTD